MIPRPLLTAAFGAALVLALAPAASAAPTIADFTIPTAASGPQHIVQGPDGNLWFTETAASRIGIVVPSSTPAISDFATPTAAASPDGITVGPDNAIWYTERTMVGKLGRVVPGAPPGTEFTVGNMLHGPRGIAVGPDNNLWIADTDDNQAAVVNTAGNLVNEFTLPAGCGTRNVTRGPDNRMWFTCFGTNVIAAVTTGGTVTPYTVPAGTNSWDITTGPDGRLWYTAPDDGFGNVTTAGVASPLFVPSGGAGDVFGITSAPDGALWGARAVANDLARVTTAGSFTLFPAPTAAARPEYITNGPANTLWGTEKDANKVFRVTGLDIPGSPTTPVSRADPAPTISGAGLTRKNILVGRGATPINGIAKSAARRKTGTTVKYTLSEAATMRLRIERVRSGRRVGRRCVKPRRGLRRRRKCKRYKHAGTLVRTSKQGRNRVGFTGRVRRRALKPGRYRFVLRAIDAAGNRSKVKRLGFKVLKPKKRKRARRRR